MTFKIPPDSYFPCISHSSNLSSNPNLFTFNKLSKKSGLHDKGGCSIASLFPWTGPWVFILISPLERGEGAHFPFLLPTIFILPLPILWILALSNFPFLFMHQFLFLYILHLDSLFIETTIIKKKKKGSNTLSLTMAPSGFFIFFQSIRNTISR